MFGNCGGVLDRLNWSRFENLTFCVVYCCVVALSRVININANIPVLGGIKQTRYFWEVVYVSWDVSNFNTYLRIYPYSPFPLLTFLAYARALLDFFKWRLSVKTGWNYHTFCEWLKAILVYTVLMYTSQDGYNIMVSN